MAVMLVLATVTTTMPLKAQETDDGYTYPPGATDEQKKQIDAEELEKWRDAGHPGANPYCDKVSDDYNGTCHDRFDTDEETDVATCNDMSHRDDPKDCPDVSGEDNDD